MDPWRTTLGPGVEGLEILGVAGEDELLEAAGVVVSRGGGAETLRFALPDGGAARLRRWTGASLGALARARLTGPRSESLAEREWNLFCHLSAHGVGAPDLLAVGARGGGPVARRSFLVFREPAHMIALDRWLGLDVAPARRERVHASLRATLEAVARAGVSLPGLGPADVWLSAEEAVTDEGTEPDCAAHVLGDLRAASAMGGLRRNRAPGVVLTCVAGGSLGPGGAPALAAALESASER